MKINISNENGIIENAFVEMSELSLSLFINSVEKYATLASIMSGHIEEGIEENTYEFWGDEEGTKIDKVTITSENEKEAEFLRFLAFELHTKGQLWFMYCDPKVYE